MLEKYGVSWEAVPAVVVTAVGGFALLGWSLSLRRQLKRKDEEIAGLQQENRTDDKTGLLNEKGLRKVYERMVNGGYSEGRDTSLPHSILMLDLDNFKGINDQLGHLAGDKVIEEFGKCMRDGTRRQYDSAGRLHGEEFMAILPHTDLDGAVLVAENIRGIFDKVAPWTVSVGVVEINTGDSFEVSMDHADRALYAAKNRGRDMIVTYDQLTLQERIAPKPSRISP